MLCSSVAKQQLARHRQNFAPPTRQTRKFHGKSQQSEAKHERAAWYLVRRLPCHLQSSAHTHTLTLRKRTVCAPEINTYPQAHHLFTIIQVLTVFLTDARVVLELKAVLHSFRRFTAAGAALATTTTVVALRQSPIYSRFLDARALTLQIGIQVYWHYTKRPCTHTRRRLLLLLHCTFAQVSTSVRVWQVSLRALVFCSAAIHIFVCHFACTTSQHICQYVCFFVRLFALQNGCTKSSGLSGQINIFPFDFAHARALCCVIVYNFESKILNCLIHACGLKSGNFTFLCNMSASLWGIHIYCSEEQSLWKIYHFCSRRANIN